MKTRLFLILFIIFSQAALAEKSVEIINLSYPAYDTVKMGMCSVGDSLFTVFELRNNTDKTLRCGASVYSFLLGISPGHGIEFEEFSNVEQTPIDVPPNESITLTLRYDAKKNLSVYPVGEKRARLSLGLYDPEASPNPKRGDVLGFKAFTLIAKKTDQAADGLFDEWNFDSVYVEPEKPAEWSCEIRNISDKTIRIDSQAVEYLTPVPSGEEFDFKPPPLPADVPPNSSISWVFKYTPRDRGVDSVLLKLFYAPDPAGAPELVDTINVKASGVGVKQKLELDAAIFPVVADTLFVGDIPIGRSKIVDGQIANSGNLPFGLLAQHLYRLSLDVEAEGFELNKGILNDTTYLYPLIKDAFRIVVEAKKIGDITARYVIESDIINRQIFGAPPEVSKVTFYIKARGVASQLSVGGDTIDFGNVVVNPLQGCSSNRDSVVYFRNNGNSDLSIRALIDPPFFKIQPVETTIAPYSEESFTISFQAHFFDVFQEDLRLVTNQFIDGDTTSIMLKAAGVPPARTKIFIPEIRSKPGRIIGAPIIVENLGTELSDRNNVSLAKTFDDTLSYDETLLKYFDFSSIRTASEPATLIDISSVEKGRLAISLKTSQNSFFLSRDTLIILKFKTYLGERISAPISFDAPRFGDYNCGQVLSLREENGYFTLDSICGLEHKAFPRGQVPIYFGEIYPAPATDYVELNYSVGFAGDIEISIFNVFGEKILAFRRKTNAPGAMVEKIDLAKFSPGTYFCRISAGAASKTRKFIIGK